MSVIPSWCERNFKANFGFILTWLKELCIATASLWSLLCSNRGNSWPNYYHQHHLPARGDLCKRQLILKGADARENLHMPPLKWVRVWLSGWYVRVQGRMMFDFNDNLWILCYTYKVSLTRTSMRSNLPSKMRMYTLKKKKRRDHRLINIILHGRQHKGFSSFLSLFDSSWFFWLAISFLFFPLIHARFPLWLYTKTTCDFTQTQSEYLKSSIHGFIFLMDSFSLEL